MSFLRPDFVPATQVTGGSENNSAESRISVQGLGKCHRCARGSVLEFDAGAVRRVGTIMTLAFAIILQQAAPSTLGLFLPIILMIGIMYLLMIRPQQSRQKKWQAMLDKLKAGDRVVTGGGIKGTIFSIKDDSVVLRCAPDNLKLEVTRGSIVTVITDDEEKKS